MENRLPETVRKHTSENSSGVAAASSNNNNNNKNENIPRRMTPNPIDDERKWGVPTAGRPSNESTAEDVEKSQPWWKNIWKKLALDPPTVLMMFKYFIIFDILIYQKLTKF
jgi:hypothetical protein